MENRCCDRNCAIFCAEFEEDQQTLVAEFGEEEELCAEFGEKTYIYKGDIEEFEGEYIITPEKEEQTLPTARKALTQDVRVLAVPFSTVSNNSGGLTANIGG